MDSLNTDFIKTRRHSREKCLFHGTAHSGEGTQSVTLRDIPRNTIPQHQWQRRIGLSFSCPSQLTFNMKKQCCGFGPDAYVFGPPGSGSASQRYGSGSGSRSFYHQAKIVRKTLIPTVLWLLFYFLSLKNYVNVPSKSNKQKKLYF